MEVVRIQTMQPSLQHMQWVDSCGGITSVVLLIPVETYVACPQARACGTEPFCEGFDS